MQLLIIAVIVLAVYWHLHYKKEGGLIPYIKNNKIMAGLTVAVLIAAVLMRDVIMAFVGPAIAMAITTYMTASLMDKIQKILEIMAGWFKKKSNG